MSCAREATTGRVVDAFPTDVTSAAGRDGDPAVMAARTAGIRGDRLGQWVEIASGPVPHIHAGLCTACGLCLVVCPYAAIAVAWGRDGAMLPWIDERRCMRCDECERACPERAVEVPFVVVLQERSRT